MGRAAPRLALFEAAFLRFAPDKRPKQMPAKSSLFSVLSCGPAKRTPKAGVQPLLARSQRTTRSSSIRVNGSQTSYKRWQRPNALRMQG